MNFGPVGYIIAAIILVGLGWLLCTGYHMADSVPDGDTTVVEHEDVPLDSSDLRFDRPGRVTTYTPPTDTSTLVTACGKLPAHLVVPEGYVNTDRIGEYYTRPEDNSGGGGRERGRVIVRYATPERIEAPVGNPREPLRRRDSVAIANELASERVAGAERADREYRFLFLPTDDRGNPAVTIEDNYTRVQAYHPRTGGGLEFEYPHPFDEWSAFPLLSARAALYGDEAFGDASATFNVRRLTGSGSGVFGQSAVVLAGGYGITYALGKARHGPQVRVSWRPLAFTW